MLPPPKGMSAPAHHMAATVVLMALWWITEAIPIPVTALLPVILFPILGIMPSSKATLPYANHLIFLFLGGFFIAIAMEKWDLHRRVALRTMLLIGTRPRRLVLGMMIGTALLSMGISNTATTMVMIPIALSILRQLVPTFTSIEELETTSPHTAHLAVNLVLGIAYAASIGGIATLIGTPPNALLAGMVEQLLNSELPFFQWLLIGFPLSVVMLFGTWWLMTRVLFPIGQIELAGGRKLLKKELRKLGAFSRPEKVVAGVGLLVGLGWIFRGLLHPKYVHDATIAMLGAIALFFFPSGDFERPYVLEWEDAARIPWGIVLLFGGGFALAKGMVTTGLDRFLVQQLNSFAHLPASLLTGGVILLAIFLTEITSNTATASLLLPLMAALGRAANIPPLILMTGACLATSFAFMLPVATPPNAIAFGSGYIGMNHMVRAGFWLNLLGTLLIWATAYIWLPFVWK
ncbi:MAG: DASS family sodium-coupled anion symporter [Calditrichaeota bacterium]|nr:MAG: DASS family sodium-coupled anion symporter [Calditrichota bacterium]